MFSQIRLDDMLGITIVFHRPQYGAQNLRILYLKIQIEIAKPFEFSIFNGHYGAFINRTTMINNQNIIGAHTVIFDEL